MSWHKLVLRLRQNLHWRHSGVYSGMTWSPCCSDVTPGPTFVSGVPRRLFPLDGYRSARNRQQYDVSPDGRRFIMIQSLADTAQSEVVYVENWFAELQAKAKK